MSPFPISRISSMDSPSFFSLILDTSATTLKISSEFVTKHLKNKIGKCPITICANGGYLWKIEMKKIGENYYFENGWSNVVKDVDFMIRDFVLFTLVDEYTFDMFVYGKDNCERSLVPKKVKDEDNDVSISVNVVNINVDVVNDDDVVDDSEDEDDSEDDDDDDDDYVVDEVYEGKEEAQEEDDDDDDVVVDIDGDPYFISAISKARQKNLRLPNDFVELTGIKDERSLILKNLGGQEWRMELRPGKVSQSKKLYILSGWADFQQNNDLSEGDECVFKFITKEDKILLAKVTKKNRRSQPSGECSKTEVVKRKRDVDVESEDESMKRLRGGDDNVENEDGKDDGGANIDGDPFFTTSIFGYKYLVRLNGLNKITYPPVHSDQGTAFSKLAEKPSGDGYNWRKYGQKLVKGNTFVRSYYKCTFTNCPARKQVERSHERNITEINYLWKHEHRKPQMLQKATKTYVRRVQSKRKKREPRSTIEGKTKCVPRVVVQTTSAVDDIVNDGYRWHKYGQKLVKGNLKPRSYYKCSSAGCFVKKHVQRASHDEKVAITTYEGHHTHDMPAGGPTVTQNMSGTSTGITSIGSRPQPESGSMEMFLHDSEDEDCDDDDDKMCEGKEEAQEEEDDDDDDDDVAIDGGDPFFMSTISKAHQNTLRLPDKFVELAGIEDERSITLKNLVGEEWRMELQPQKVNQWKKLYISSGWADFQQNNDLSEGDECVFKFITRECKILLEKVTKKNRWPVRQSQPFGECSKTEVVKRKWVRDVDVEIEDEYMETMKRLRGSGDDYEKEDGKDDGGANIDGDPFITTSIFEKPSGDGYNWRKYGQKLVKGNTFVRSYYKCTFTNCPARKLVERSHDSNITEINYLRKHEHSKPHMLQKVTTTYVRSVQSKRKKRKSRSTIEGKTKCVPRVVVQTISAADDIVNDGYRWHKYGQKLVKGNLNPRSYYKCTSAGCFAKKHVQRASYDEKVDIATYEGHHTHDMLADGLVVTQNMSRTSTGITSDGSIPQHESGSIEMVLHVSAT